MKEKQVIKFYVLDSTDKDVSVAFVYEDGTKEILVMTHDAVKALQDKVVPSEERK